MLSTSRYPLELYPGPTIPPARPSEFGDDQRYLVFAFPTKWYPLDDYDDDSIWYLQLTKDDYDDDRRYLVFAFPTTGSRPEPADKAAAQGEKSRHFCLIEDFQSPLTHNETFMNICLVQSSLKN